MSVVIETTLGDITVDLYLSDRPRACLNFLKLCKIKYYNYNLFHTISRGFMAQTGDPTGSRKGGESFYGVLDGPEKRYFEGENEPRIKHTKMGLISFVGNDERMIGSQFFITLGEDLIYLDQKHCVFGEVVEGLDILEIINEVICDTDDRPYQDVRITHTVILDDPYPDPKRLRVPSRSPSPSSERLQGGRIAPDEDVDETEGKSAQEVAELQAEREAKARATILEMVGDLPDAEMAPPENVLFVCKLNPVTTDDDLEIIFNRFGKIVSCEVIRDRKTGDSLQYAFIEFADRKSCEDAYFKMDNILIDDRRIHVDFSQSVSKVIWHGKGRGVTHYDEDGRKTKLGSSDIGTGNYKTKYQKPKNLMGYKNDRQKNNGRDISNSDSLKSSKRKHEKSRSKSPLEDSYNPNGLESRKRGNKEKSLSSRSPSRKDKRESRPTPSKRDKFRPHSRSLSPHRERPNRPSSRSPRRRIDDRRERKSDRYWDNSKREEFSHRRYEDSSRRNEYRPPSKDSRHSSFNRSSHFSSKYPERESKNERFGSSSNSHRNSRMSENERDDKHKHYKEEKGNTVKYISPIKKSNSNNNESYKREIAEKERKSSSDAISKSKKKKKESTKSESDSSESETKKIRSKKKKKKDSTDSNSSSSSSSSDSSDEETAKKKKMKRKKQKSSDSSSESEESDSSESESSDSEDEKRNKKKKSKKRSSKTSSESSEDERRKYKKKKKRKH